MSAPEHQLRQQADGVGSRAPAPAAFPRDTVLRAGLLAALLGAMLWAYRDTLAAMVGIWDRSETFAHGYLIAPIALWLVWRQRERLRAVPVGHSVAGIVALGAAGFAWLLGELASVASVSQFALVGMIVALVWAVMGTAMARALAFPLAFLFFLVPFGEFLFPWMMDRTTDFVIWGLRSSGVPVYAEGRNLVIPSGRWSVVEGCSGVRYLIASVVVGSLYAHLTYRSLHRRLLFVAVSVVLPVFANWLRAYGIVMLAHLSDNRIAAGVDHLIYGWVFFGAVMLVLFWIGGRWREDAPRAQPAVAPSSGLPALPRLASGALVLPLLVTGGVAFGGKAALAALTDGAEPGRIEWSAIPPAGGWQPAAAGALAPWSPRYAGMRGELNTAWARDGQLVGVYVAYYRNQGAGSELINSENRVLRNKDPDWSMAAYGGRDTALGTEPLRVRSTEIFNPSGRLLVWNWYWIGGRWTASDYAAKAYQAMSVLSGRGDGAAAVMLYAPVGDGGRAAAEAALDAFARDMGPGIGHMLERLGGG